MCFSGDASRRAVELADEWSSNVIHLLFWVHLLSSLRQLLPRQAKNSGAKLIIINRDETPLDKIADLAVHEGIGDYLESRGIYEIALKI